MTEIYLTPFEENDAVELSRTLFRKKILPLGKINYQGREISFDKQYLTDLASAYTDQAFDQVPFMLADKDNRHTMDPDRYRGECKGVEVREDGLYGMFDLTADAAALVKQNPKLGVSARIVEGYDRSDGKKYPRAMQHVLGTLDPRLPGLGAWQEVALSGYDGDADVVNLTEATYEGDAVTDQQPKNEIVLEDLSDEEIRALLKAAGIDVDAEADAETEVEDLTEDEETEVTERDEELVTLSNQHDDRIAALEAKLAESNWQTQRSTYVAKGVPPALVELARPVLEHHEAVTIDLSNGVTEKKVDASDVVRKLLDSMSGYLDLARERGHSFDPSQMEDNEAENSRVDALLEQWKTEYGI